MRKIISIVFFVSYSLEINALNIVEHLDDQNVPKITDPVSVEGQIVHKLTKLLYSFAKNGYDL